MKSMKVRDAIDFFLFSQNPESIVVRKAFHNAGASEGEAEAEWLSDPQQGPILSVTVYIPGEEEVRWHFPWYAVIQIVREGRIREGYIPTHLIVDNNNFDPYWGQWELRNFNLYLLQRKRKRFRTYFRQIKSSHEP
jgi:hypothetical protein